MEEEGEVGCGQEGTSILLIRTGEAMPGSGDVGADGQGLDKARTRMRPWKGQGGARTGIKAGPELDHGTFPHQARELDLYSLEDDHGALNSVQEERGTTGTVF